MSDTASDVGGDPVPDAIADDIEAAIGADIPARPVAEPRRFKPWHKPRKHWVRIHQWCRLGSDLIKESEFPDGKVVRYLSLPGSDFLDIRTLDGVLKRKDAQLKFVGFDSSATSAAHGDATESAEFNISRAEIYNLPTVHANSITLTERFEAIANTKSHAYQKVKEAGPYHIVNLDFCGSVMTQDLASAEFETLVALRNLLTIQVKHPGPWLLWITMRVDSQTIGLEPMKQVLAVVRENANKHQSFRDRLNAINVSEAEIAKTLDAGAIPAADVFRDAFVLGFSKWLLGQMVTSAPPVSVELASAAGYSVSGETIDLVSLAFKMTPHHALGADASALGGTSSEAALPSEEALALSLITSVETLIDVDSLLRDQPATNDKLINQASKIMEQARYPVDEYQAWARGQAVV